MRSLLGVLAATLIVAGCSSTPKLEPKGQRVVNAALNGELEKITIPFLYELAIKLPPPTVHGTIWTLALNDGRFLQLRRPIEVAGDGSATATFLAIRPGRRPIRFFALPPPPNDREAWPAGAYEVVVTIEQPAEK